MGFASNLIFYHGFCGSKVWDTIIWELSLLLWTRIVSWTVTVLCHWHEVSKLEFKPESAVMSAISRFPSTLSVSSS